MEKLRKTTRTILNPLNCTPHPNPSNVHFKPLSRYTMAGVPCTHNHKGSLGLLKNIPSLFCDVPVGMVENVAPKRKLDDSCLDDSYETPAKKPYIPSTYSPDLGFDCDSFNIDTPNSVSQQSLLERRKAVKYPNKDAIADVKINLHLSSSSECCALSEETGGVQSDGPNRCTSSPKTGILMPEVVPLNRGDSLKFNINHGLCLSPIIWNTGHPIRAGNTVDGWLCPRSRGPLAPNPTAGRQVAEEEQSTDWAREGWASSSATSANTVTEGSGGPLPRHFHLQFLSTVSGSSQPVAKKPFQVHTAPPSGNWDLRDALCNGSDALGASKVPVEALEGISAPIFESTVCHGPLDATLGGEHTVDDSFEDSLPLQLQLKSAVFVVKNHASGSSTSRTLLHNRPVVFISERDWNHKKHLYVDSVLRHIQQPCGPDGPMSQLLNLMGHVAEQHRWQHPSDLTARNYRQRFGNVSTRMSLSEWKARSSRNHQGFSSVPAMFHRSPVP